MLILSSTTDKIELVLGSAADVDYMVSYTKLNLSGAAPVVDDAQPISGTYNTVTTPLSITGSPALSTDRWSIGSIELRNRHATTSTTVQLQHVKAGGTARQLILVTLLPGEKLTRDRNGVWFHYDANGGVYGAVATAMKRVILTSGTAATYTPGVGCRAIRVRLKAAGAQGGGSTSAASSGGGGGGGGEGGTTEKLISPPAASYLYTIGAGGSGAAAGAAGNNGADTTFGSLTAKGGSGGGLATAAAATRAVGGAGGIAGSGGDINDPGAPGGIGVNTTAALAVGGSGGGKGANGSVSAGTGAAAGANTGGGGAGGVVVSASAAAAGGAGGSGYIDIEELY